jgi:uncharacterized protein (DUF952 family)
MFIYHIVLPETWESFKGRPSYAADSLQTEGFIHCSFDSQLDAVISRYYANTGRIFVLKLDTGKLRSKLVEEASTNGEIYPHLYGRLNMDAIVDVEERVVSREQA